MCTAFQDPKEDIVDDRTARHASLVGSIGSLWDAPGEMDTSKGVRRFLSMVGCTALSKHREPEAP